MVHSIKHFGIMLRKLSLVKCISNYQVLYRSFNSLRTHPCEILNIYVDSVQTVNHQWYRTRSLRPRPNYYRFLQHLSSPQIVEMTSVICRRPLHTSPSRGFPQGEVQTESEQKDPDTIAIARQEIDILFQEMRRELGMRKVMKETATYYFDGRGKSLRPLITLLMAKAINNHLQLDHQLLNSQREMAKMIEMIHASSLLHDDVIDGSDMRRGKPAVHSLYSHRRAVMVGDFVLSVAATMAARLRHEGVLVLLSQVLVDLVEGEFMQLGSKEKTDERFNHYLRKTFNKTASLIAFSCKAVALLAGANEEVQEIAFQYGKNCGIAFQLVDDLLDFTSTSNNLGKPSLNDLKSGLATAPVLFACEKFPDLNAMIMRRFEGHDDMRKALEYVGKSDGLEQTKFLAQKHCQEAIRQIRCLKPCPEQRSLMLLTDDIVNRSK